MFLTINNKIVLVSNFMHFLKLQKNEVLRILVAWNENDVIEYTWRRASFFLLTLFEFEILKKF